MSKDEALRRQGERTAPIEPRTPPSQEKRETMQHLADERSEAVLDQLHHGSDERMRHPGAEDAPAGYPGTEATAGNEANIGHPDVPAGDNPQT